MSVTVERVEKVTDEVAAALRALLPQLSSSAPPNDDTLATLCAHEANTVLVARLDDRIVGTLTLVLFPLMTGVRARIEDVVVEEDARGRGVASALTTEALRIASDGGARTVDLTSRPSREAANRLYRGLGFVARDSQVYRYPISE